MSITVMLIDDERPALKVMEILLKKYDQIEVVGRHANARKAIEDVRFMKPDVVMLDIDMPIMNGMQVAELILDCSPKTEIVFITAYEEYALKAYQFHPMDYILKPVNEKRLDVLITYLYQKLNTVPVVRKGKLLLRCFGEAYVKWEDEAPIKWRTEKTKEIFAYLVDHYDETVTKEEILESLWPEENPDKAMKQLYNGIYYIRKALSDYGVDDNHMVIDSMYHLIIKDVDLDVQLFKNKNVDMKRKLELFTGQYFEKHDYDWIQLKREEFFLLYQKYLIELVESYLKDKNYEGAETLLIKATQEDPINERIAETLLRLFLQTKNKIKGISFYQAYEKIIKDELNERPSKVMSKYYNELKLL